MNTQTTLDVPRWFSGWRLWILALLLGLVATGGVVMKTDTVYFGVDTMAVHEPFRTASAENGAAPVELLNPALSDQGQFFYPYYRWVSESWRAGEPPLWNPYVYAGAPGHGNAQSGALDPQVLALVALDAVGGKAWFDWGLGALATLRLAAAFLGVLLLARCLGLGVWGASFAGVGFALSGFQVLWLNHSLGHVAPFLPWILLSLERVREGRRWAGPVTALLLAGAVLGGHPETSFYVGFAAGVWALAIAREDFARGSRALAALASGALLSAVCLLPFVEYLGLSAAQYARSTNHAQPELQVLALAAWFIVLGLGAWFARLGTAGGAEWESKRGWPLGVAGLVIGVVGLSLFLGDNSWFDRAAIALLPDRYGSPAHYTGALNVLEAASPWLAAPILAFALAGCLSHGRLRRRGVLVGLGVVMWLLSLEAPGFIEVYRWVPVVGLGATVRMASVSALFLSLLAGDALESATRPARVAAFALLAVALGVLLAPGGTNADFESRAAESDSMCTIVERPSSVLRGEDSVVELHLDARVQLTGNLEIVVLPLLESGGADTERGVFRIPMEERLSQGAGASRVFRTQALVTSRLAEGRWRFDAEIPVDRGPLIRRFIGESMVERVTQRPVGSIAFLIGALALLCLTPSPLVRVVAVCAALVQALLFAWAANPSVPSAACFPATLTGEVLRELQTQGQRVFSDSAVLPPATSLTERVFALQGYDGMDPREFNGFRGAFSATANGLLGFNPRGVDMTNPAFRLLGVGQLLMREPLEVPGWNLVAGPGQAREAEVFVYDAEAPDPRAWVVGDVTDPDSMRKRVEAGADPFTLACVEEDWRPAAPLSRGVVTDLRWTNNSVRATVETDGDGLVVFSEQKFPGWIARVDGVEQPVLEADYNFRGVSVTAGTHTVELRYEPRSLRMGLLLSAVGALLALATAFGAEKRSSEPGN